VTLVADLADGRRVRGESAIPRSGAPVVRVAIEPADAAPALGVLEALGAADLVILGPGSFFTSVLATVTVPGIAAAIVSSKATKIFVCNLMTEPGETDRFGVAAHLDALHAHGLPPDTFDYVVLNDAAIPLKTRTRYAADGAEPVSADWAESPDGPVVVTADLLASGPVVRHDHDKIGRLLCALATADRRPPAASFQPGAAAGLPPVAVNLTR
jgi:uncharacterized cofD-like protein